MERRLQKRYWLLVGSHMKVASPHSAAIAKLPATSSGFAATQAAWRFFSNERVSLHDMMVPIRDVGRLASEESDSNFVLAVHDWSKIGCGSHRSKKDLARLTHSDDIGYELFSCLMVDGKKSTAYRIMYDAMDMMQERTGKDPLELFEQAMSNVKPVIEVKPRRVGGATYQVPVEVSPERRIALAMRWLLASSRARNGRTMAEKLAGELLDAANNTGSAIKKREDTHRMAEANRAFAHYRW